MFASAFIVLLMAGLLIAMPVGFALFFARQPEALARWPEGWVAHHRVHRDEPAAYRAMPIASVERRRVVRAGVPRLLAAAAGLCAMLAFAWVVACVLTLLEVCRAALHGAFAGPLVASGLLCLARAAAGFTLVGAVFARRPRRVAVAVTALVALDALVARGFRITDSGRGDACVAAAGLALTVAVGELFAYAYARRQ